jgi:hypothetical protein
MSYLIEIENQDQEVFRIIANSDLQMMAVLKKCILNNYIIITTQAMGYVTKAEDFLNENNEDLNIG